MSSVNVGRVTIAGTGALIANNVLEFDNNRRYARVSNNLATPAFISVGTNALYGNGIALASFGSAYELPVSRTMGAGIKAVGTANILDLSYQVW